MSQYSSTPKRSKTIEQYFHACSSLSFPPFFHPFILISPQFQVISIIFPHCPQVFLVSRPGFCEDLAMFPRPPGPRGPGPGDQPCAARRLAPCAAAVGGPRGGAAAAVAAGGGEVPRGPGGNPLQGAGQTFSKIFGGLDLDDWIWELYLMYE